MKLYRISAAMHPKSIEVIDNVKETAKQYRYMWVKQTIAIPKDTMWVRYMGKYFLTEQDALTSLILRINEIIERHKWSKEQAPSLHAALERATERLNQLTNNH